MTFLADDIEREARTLARQSPVPPEALDESRAAAAVRLQRAAGIPGPRVFSKAALAEQVEAFLGATSDQRIGLVQALDDRFGAFAGQAKDELAGALDPLNGALVRRADDPLAVFGLRRALAAGPGELRKAAAPADLLAVEAELDRAGITEPRDRAAVRLMALVNLRDGHDVASAVAAARETVLGGGQGTDALTGEAGDDTLRSEDSGSGDVDEAPSLGVFEPPTDSKTTNLPLVPGTMVESVPEQPRTEDGKIVPGLRADLATGEGVLIHPENGQPILAPDGKPYEFTEERMGELFKLAGSLTPEQRAALPPENKREWDEFMRIFLDFYVSQAGRAPSRSSPEGAQPQPGKPEQREDDQRISPPTKGKGGPPDIEGPPDLPPGAVPPPPLPSDEKKRPPQRPRVPGPITPGFRIPPIRR